MDYRSVSAKMPVNEVTLFKSFCEKKGVTPASLIRDLILREIKVPIPHTVAGNNNITYDKRTDQFMWSVELDNGEEVNVMRNISPVFLEELQDMVSRVLDERASFIGKVRDNSVPVPSNILRGMDDYFKRLL